MIISNITSVISSVVASAIASTISLFLNTPIDKVAYIDTTGECKYVEIYKPFSEPEYRTCKIRDASFEVVYVDPCLEKVTRDGVKSSQEKCSLD